MKIVLDTFTAVKSFLFKIKTCFFSTIQEQVTYEFLSFEEKNQQYTLHIKLVNKSSPLIKVNPEQIVRDDELLEKFSKKDIRTISYYAMKNKYERLLKEKEITFQVILNSFSESGEPIIAFKNIIKGTKDIVKAKALSDDPSLYSKFSAKNLIKIGHLIGYYEAEQDLNRIKLYRSYNDNT